MHSPFLDRSIGKHTFITADPQFGSSFVFEHVAARRLFGSMKRLQQKMVDNWNALVGRDDAVLCLGDFTQNMKQPGKSMNLLERYSRMLNGRKILIRGNHDLLDTQFYFDCGWTAVIEFPLLMLGQDTRWLNVPSVSAGCIIRDIGELRIMFSHFAIFDEDDDDRRYLLEKAYLRELFHEHACDINIHGHTHDRPIADARCHSACVEQTHFSPVRLEQFLSRNGVGTRKKIA